MVFNIFNNNDPDNNDDTDSNTASNEEDNEPDEERHDSSEFQYDYTPIKREKLGEKYWAEIGAEEDEYYAGPHIRANIENAQNNPEQKLYLGADYDDQRGLQAGTIKFEDLFRHMWMSGASGYGKSTEQKSIMTQLAYGGHGFVYFDPKGKDSRDLLRMLPEHRLDDVIWIEPGSTEYDKNIGINIIGVPETEDETENALAISDRLENLRAVFDQYDFWGPNMQGITDSVGRGMMNHNADPETDFKYSIIDMFLILANQYNRRNFAEEVDDPFVRIALDKIADMDDEDIWPIFNRISEWAKDPIIRRIISQRENTINFDDVLDENKIVIVRTPVTNSSVKKMVTLSVLRGVWSAIQRRSFESGTQKPFFAIADEFDDIASDNLDVEDILVRARSMNLGVFLSTQYPSQLDADIQKAMKNNCDNLVTFYHGDEEDADIMMSRFRDYGAADLMESDRYEIWMQLRNSDGEKVEATKLKTYPPYPPLRSDEEVDAIIQNSLDKYGDEPLSTRGILDSIPSDELGVDVDYLVDILDEAETLDDVEEENEGTPFDDPDGIVGSSIPGGDSELFEEVPEKTVVQAIATAQLQSGLAPTDPVSVDTVQRILQHHTDNQNFASDLASEYTDVSHSSITATTTDDGALMLGLTQTAQETIYNIDTGGGGTDGGENHTPLLKAAHIAFTTFGYHSEIVPQDGTEQPDGIATSPLERDINANVATADEFEAQIEAYHNQLRDIHPNLPEVSNGRDLALEAETSPGKKPARPLQNLRKAFDANRKCAFIVRDDGKKLDRFAARTARILEAPAFVSEKTDTRTKYYSHSHAEHEATIEKDGEEYNIASPNVPNSGSNWWDTDSDSDYEFISNKDDSVFLSVENPWEITLTDLKGSECAYYQRDRSERVYNVWIPDGSGFVKKQYDTKSQFSEEWSKVHEPFNPEREFGESLPDQDDYMIIINTDDERTNVPGLDYVPSLVEYHVNEVRDDAHQTVDAEYTPFLPKEHEPPQFLLDENETSDSTDTENAPWNTPNDENDTTEENGTPTEEESTDTTTADEDDFTQEFDTDDEDTDAEISESTDTPEAPDSEGSGDNTDSGMSNGYNKNVEFGGSEKSNDSGSTESTEEEESDDVDEDTSEDGEEDGGDSRLFG